MEWCLIEVMGHRRYAGEVEQVTVIGVPMLRVHVPAWTRTRTEREGWDTTARQRQITERYPAFQVDLGGSALFAMTRCSEAAARAELPRCHEGPDAPAREEGEWVPVATKALTGPVEDAQEVEDGIPFDGDTEDQPIPDEEYERRQALAEHPCPGRRCEVCMGNTEHHWCAEYDGVHDFYACKHCDAITEDLDDDGELEDGDDVPVIRRETLSAFDQAVSDTETAQRIREKREELEARRTALVEEICGLERDLYDLPGGPRSLDFAQIEEEVEADAKLETWAVSDLGHYRANLQRRISALKASTATGEAPAGDAA